MGMEMSLETFRGVWRAHQRQSHAGQRRLVLVENLQGKAIRRGLAEPTPCLGVNNTSFVYSSQKCDSNYPFSNSACICHDSTTCPSRGCADSGMCYTSMKSDTA